MATLHVYYHEHVLLDSLINMPFPATAPEMLVGISQRHYSVWGLNPSSTMALEIPCWYFLAT